MFRQLTDLSRMDEVEVPQETHDDNAKHRKTDDAENGAKPWSNAPIAYSASSVSPSPSSDSSLKACHRSHKADDVEPHGIHYAMEIFSPMLIVAAVSGF